MKTIRFKIEIAGMDTVLYTKPSEPIPADQYEQVISKTKEFIKTAVKGESTYLGVELQDSIKTYIGKDLLPKAVISIIVEDTNKLTTPDGPY